MSVWQVSLQGAHLRLGRTLAHKLHARGCNQPFKGRFWCPKKGWFNTKPCPFTCRTECDNFRRMCGAL